MGRNMEVKVYLFGEIEAIQYDLSMEDKLWRNEILKKYPDNSPQKTLFDLDIYLKNE